jgi:hypothetical protein
MQTISNTDRTITFNTNNENSSSFSYELKLIRAAALILYAVYKALIARGDRLQRQ